MGQEHAGKGKHFLFYIAGCLSILLGLCGCVHLLDQWQGEQDLREARDLMDRGDFSASEQKAVGVMTAFPKALGDEALFQIGLLYTLPNNPYADYEKSIAFFEKLVTIYPDSSRKEEAAAWLSALNKIVDYKKETFELQQKVRLLEDTSESRGKRLRRLQEELQVKGKDLTGQRGKEFRRLQEELEERKREIIDYLETVNQLQNRVIELESQLANFKNIDLSIEQKKRGTAP
jgi:hypothetical protein